MKNIIKNYETPISNFVIVSPQFSEEELQKIIDYCETKDTHHGFVGNNTLDHQVRNSNISWISKNRDSEWFFERLIQIVSKVNYENFQFDLTGFDILQYTKYEKDQLYNWHQDIALGYPENNLHRKLSFSLILNSAEKDYSGGEFGIVNTGDIHKTETIPLAKGQIIFFPSFVSHKVYPVNTGTRKSLVGWVIGPKFK